MTRQETWPRRSAGPRSPTTGASGVRTASRNFSRSPRCSATSQPEHRETSVQRAFEYDRHLMARAREASRCADGATPNGSNAKGVQLKTKVWFEVKGHFVIGDGGLRLLEGILTHGSLLGAAREMGWSYRHAWGYLKRAEEALGAALTVAR